MNHPPPAVKGIFWNNENELRSGWRVAIFLFLLLLFILALSPLVREVLPRSAETGDARAILVDWSSAHAVSLISALIATAICTRMLERRTLLSVGLRLYRGCPRDFILGLGIGAGTVTIAIGVSAMFGATRFNQTAVGVPEPLYWGLALSAFFLLGSTVEELIFRGYPFQALVHNLGAPMALALTSVAFGVAHMANPSSTIFSTANTTLAGVWLGLGYLVTRSLWLPIAIHFAWNFVMVFVFGLPVSGITIFQGRGILTGVAVDPVWLSGGEYGPEGGAAASLALILSCLLVWRSGIFKPSGEMIEAIRHGPARPHGAPATNEVPGK